VLDYLPQVASVRHVREHTLWVRFTDGLEGEVDLHDGLKGVIFDSIRDPADFRQARVEQGVVTWPSGVDWAPESMYERLLAANPSYATRIGAVREAELAYIAAMPEISRFHGIIIRMLPNDHAPPHFHASYREYRLSVTIGDAELDGRFPRSALRLVLEWHDLHQAELLANWRLLAGQPAHPIPPLS